jgi:hypothetical protein
MGQQKGDIGDTEAEGLYILLLFGSINNDFSEDLIDRYCWGTKVTQTDYRAGGG